LEEVGKAGSDAIKAGQALKIGKDAFNAGSNIAKAGQALEAGQATVSVAKSVSAVAIGVTVASVALTVVDVAFLIRDWTSDHPTIAMINDVIKQLTEELKRFENLKSILDTFREKVYFSTIDNIPIFGPTTAFNGAVIALFNSNIAECIKVLKQYDIHWPFPIQFNEYQFIQFLKNLDIAKGYDIEQVTSIIKKRGKKATTAILMLVKDISNVLKAKKNSLSEDRKHSRGEHVINNGVLAVHKDIIDRFLHYQFHTTFQEVRTRLNANSRICSDYEHPLPSDIKRNIQFVMIARFRDDELYFDTNALLYGVLIEVLRESAKLHMTYLYNNPTAKGTEHTSKVRTTASQMNILLAYVDQAAKNHWLTVDGGDLVRYEISVQAVKQMFQNLYQNLDYWVLELKGAGY
jgi:hypothetical protein